MSKLSFTKISVPDGTMSKVVGDKVIDCTATRRCAFQLKSNTGGNATVHVQGSVDKETWLTFGTMETNANASEDGGNAEFIWPHIRFYVESNIGADAEIAYTKRV
jgi:hypothetical protein